jgi:hypothetical protein
VMNPDHLGIVQTKGVVMITLNERYITDAAGNRIAVVLDLETFEHLIELLEDAEDEAWAADYERRKVAGLLAPDELETVPLDQAIVEIESQWKAEEKAD